MSFLAVAANERETAFGGNAIPSLSVFPKTAARMLVLTCATDSVTHFCHFLVEKGVSKGIIGMYCWL